MLLSGLSSFLRIRKLTSVSDNNLVGCRVGNSENGSWASDLTGILNSKVPVSTAISSIRREGFYFWPVFSFQSDNCLWQCVLGACAA